MNIGFQPGHMPTDTGFHTGNIEMDDRHRIGNTRMNISGELRPVNIHSPNAIWDLWTLFVTMFSANLFTLFLKSGNQATQNNCHSYLVMKVNLKE